MSVYYPQYVKDIHNEIYQKAERECKEKQDELRKQGLTNSEILLNPEYISASIYAQVCHDELVRVLGKEPKS